MVIRDRLEQNLAIGLFAIVRGGLPLNGSFLLYNLETSACKRDDEKMHFFLVEEHT
jgi:hypothetical protein